MYKEKILKTTLAGVLATAMVVSGLGMQTPQKSVKAAETRVNLNGKYHAALGLQVAGEDWYARMAYYGKDENPQYGTADANTLVSGDKKAQGVFTDTEIAGNGTYEVSLKDAQLPGNTCITQMHIATDIPGKDNNDQIKFKNIKVNLNDKDIVTFENAVMEDEKYNESGRVVLLFNHWRDSVKQVLEKKGIKEDKDGYNLLKGTGKESITVTFDVEGFNYKKGETPDDGSAWMETEPPAAKVGTVKTVGGIKYKVTKSAKKNGTVIALKNTKKAASRKIPASVKIGDYKFKVTEIAASAFANDNKLTKVTIGGNVTKIGSKAFSGAKNLKSVTVSSKNIKSVGKNAFKGVPKNCQLKVPKSKTAKYKKLFANKGTKFSVK